jgi:hypothetical protein
MVGPPLDVLQRIDAEYQKTSGWVRATHPVSYQQMISLQQLGMEVLA